MWDDFFLEVVIVEYVIMVDIWLYIICLYFVGNVGVEIVCGLGLFDVGNVVFFVFDGY